MVEEKTPTQQVQVKIPDNIASGVYANIVNINANQNEVVLDFILHIPSQQYAVLSSRIIISSETAQQLSDLLEALLRQIKDVQKEIKKGQ